MLPRLPRDGVITAIQQIADALATALRAAPPCQLNTLPKHLLVGSKGLLFAIHKRNRKLDRLGCGYVTEFHHVTMSDVMAYMNFDVYHNDIFLIGSRVAKQKRGVAIGGLCSPQAAQLYCMMREVPFHQTSGTPTHTMWSRLPPHALPISSYRYMDNLVGALCGEIGLKRIQRVFEKIYDLEFQQEAEGLILPSLEALLSVDPTTGEISIRLKQKVDWSLPPHKRYSSFPDKLAVQAKQSTRSICVSQGLKSASYSASWEYIAHNSRACISEFLSKEYPMVETRVVCRRHTTLAVRHL